MEIAGSDTIYNRILFGCLVLMYLGVDALKEVIANAELYPVQGLFRFQDYFDEIDAYYNCFLGNEVGVSTGWRAVDDFYKGLEPDVPTLISLTAIAAAAATAAAAAAAASATTAAASATAAAAASAAAAAVPNTTVAISAAAGVTPLAASLLRRRSCIVDRRRHRCPLHRRLLRRRLAYRRRRKICVLRRFLGLPPSIHITC
ncbi:Twinkle-like protein [Nymphaea thermarum]|nr:Twinkle-like protein [Nymphaea thermarum]